MIDLRRLDDPSYRAGIVKKGCPEALLEELEQADAHRRRELARVEELRAKRNAVSKQIAKASPEERQQKLAEATVVKEQLSGLERELSALEERVEALALRIPNPAHETVPGGGEEDGEVVREVGERAPAPPLDHADFGEAMHLVDTRRAAVVSGSRFAFLLGKAVFLELALVRWTMDRLGAEGFCPVIPPVLVRESTMQAAGFFPTDRNQVYRATSATEAGEEEETDADDLFLVGTSEVPMSGLHLDDILQEGVLPLRYGGFSTCFRREAGTYGRDTRGIFRVHQFDKVEMFSFAHPDESWDELEKLLAVEESLVSELGLPYRVVNIAAGDLGAPAAKKYDLEVWLPSEGRYREITSCSNYTDYSARRLGTRFRSGEGTRLVHTLNGTACAVGRTLVFLFEHYQEAGALVVPEVLRPYTGFDRVERPS